MYIESHDSQVALNHAKSLVFFKRCPKYPNFLDTFDSKVIITDDVAEADKFVAKWKTLSEVEKAKKKIEDDAKAEEAKAKAAEAESKEDDDDDDSED